MNDIFKRRSLLPSSRKRRERGESLSEETTTSSNSASNETAEPTSADAKQHHISSLPQQRSLSDAPRQMMSTLRYEAEDEDERPTWSGDEFELAFRLEREKEASIYERHTKIPLPGEVTEIPSFGSDSDPRAASLIPTARNYSEIEAEAGPESAPTVIPPQNFFDSIDRSKDQLRTDQAKRSLSAPYFELADKSEPQHQPPQKITLPPNSSGSRYEFGLPSLPPPAALPDDFAPISGKTDQELEQAIGKLPFADAWHPPSSTLSATALNPASPADFANGDVDPNASEWARAHRSSSLAQFQAPPRIPSSNVPSGLEVGHYDAQHSTTHAPTNEQRTSDPQLEWSVPLGDVAPVSEESTLAFVDQHPRATQQLPELRPSRPVHPIPTPYPSKSSSSKEAFKAIDSSQEILERYAVGDFSGALAIAEEKLKIDPQDPTAKKYAEQCRRSLEKMCLARLGSLGKIPNLAVAPSEIRWLSLDHRAGFLVSQIDGRMSLDDLLDISGMGRLDTLKILTQLFDQKVISLS